MRLSITALALLIALAAPPAAAFTAACGAPVAAADGWEVERDPAMAGFHPHAICEVVQTFVESSRNLHGLVVERQGRLVAEAYRDGSDRSTYSVWASRRHFDSDALHDIRSITKSIVALLWGIAEAEGSAPSVTTPVLDLLPALADLRSDGRDHITVADLLCMRSGLRWDESGGYGRWANDEKGLLWRADRARYVLDRPLAESPGRQFNYNGGLTAVLGLLLEERTGMDLRTYARLKLFEPLGIRTWEWVGDLRGRPRAYTGLRLTPRDLARLGRLVLDEGRWKGRQLVSAEWLRRMLAPCPGSGDFGYHWWSGTVWVDGKQLAWKGALGNGGQRLFLVPELDLVVVTTAGEYDDSTVGRAQQYLLQQVVASTREHGPPMAPASLERVPAASPVEKRATLRSITREDGGKRVYVHLKVALHANLPFTTLRFYVRDPALLSSLQKGATVKFRAERIAGENTLVSIRAVPPCVRFQPCD
ncbi:serine hydrolase [Ramlibacter sp. AN1015]|uniref:serine hydrolase n=1 Tax=Ramlibacter sp. AN1015 TaxID=3133428 RepID=UPI0030C2AF97